jgi:hypothetical protein
MSSVTHTTRTVERIVWNGKVTSHGGGVNKLNTILDQITETGECSDALFSRSIRDLYQTVLAASISEVELTSQLLVDMLDRNLYERANDCRWWALTAQLRSGLAFPSAAQADAMGDVLAHINRLYTVYARLVVYDRTGRIVAVTGEQSALGLQIDADTLSRVCALRSELDHYAEPFTPCPRAARGQQQPRAHRHARCDAGRCRRRCRWRKQQPFVWVFDLALLATGRAGDITDNSQVMLVQIGSGTIGLLVDDLLSVQQFDAEALIDSPLGAAETALAPRLIKANDGNLLIEEIDLERLFSRVRGGG